MFSCTFIMQFVMVDGSYQTHFLCALLQNFLIAHTARRVLQTLRCLAAAAPSCRVFLFTFYSVEKYYGMIVMSKWPTADWKIFLFIFSYWWLSCSVTSGAVMGAYASCPFRFWGSVHIYFIYCCDKTISPHRINKAYSSIRLLLWWQLQISL